MRRRNARRYGQRRCARKRRAASSDGRSTPHPTIASFPETGGSITGHHDAYAYYIYAAIFTPSLIDPWIFNTVLCKRRRPVGSVSDVIITHARACTFYRRSGPRRDAKRLIFMIGVRFRRGRVRVTTWRRRINNTSLLRPVAARTRYFTRRTDSRDKAATTTTTPDRRKRDLSPVYDDNDYPSLYLLNCYYYYYYCDFVCYRWISCKKNFSRPHIIVFSI